jgi:hypothetical protein
MEALGNRKYHRYIPKSSIISPCLRLPKYDKNFEPLSKLSTLEYAKVHMAKFKCLLLILEKFPFLFDIHNNDVLRFYYPLQLQ